MRANPINTLKSSLKLNSFEIEKMKFEVSICLWSLFSSMNLKRLKFGSKIGGRSTNESNRMAKTVRTILRRMANKSRDPAAGVVASQAMGPDRRPAEALVAKVITIINKSSSWWWRGTASAMRRTTTATCRAISNWKIQTIRWITNNTCPAITRIITIRPLENKQKNKKQNRNLNFSKHFHFFSICVSLSFDYYYEFGMQISDLGGAPFNY